MSTHRVVIAGASGLVGNCLLHHLLQQDEISDIYSLARKSLHLPHEKLTEFLDPELRITQWDESLHAPSIGFICLGTTLRQAGSKQALAAIDVDLVIEVAKQMRYLGVTRLGVISSHGAYRHHPSHYLRCKGKMEFALQNLGFSQICFARPGPLAGERHTPRADEMVIKKLTRIASPLLRGPLRAFLPVNAEQVAVSLYKQTLNTQDTISVLSARMLLENAHE